MTDGLEPSKEDIRMTLPSTPVQTARRGGSLVTVALLLAGAVAVAGVAFAAGRTTAPVSTGRTGLTGSQFPASGPQGVSGARPGGSFAPGTGGFPGGAPLGAGAMTVTGTVAKIDASSLTLTLSSGSTLDVRIDASTTYHGQVAATAGDVKVGSDVVVQLGGLGSGAPGAGGPGAGAPSASASPAPVAPGAGAAADGGAARGSATARDVTIAAP
jgi:hypothetical protein